jgi:raw score 10.29
MEKADKKEYDRAGKSTKKTNSALRNAGSRFGITVKHNLDNDFYALGRLEFRFDDTDSRDKFGRLYAKRAYVGLGSKATGDITFGRQLTIADDLSQAVDYEYGLIPKEEYIPTAGTGVIRYDYKGIEGLQLSANYNFGQKNNEKGKALDPAIKNAFGFGALYTAGDLDARFAYGHTSFETDASYKHRLDGFLASLGYKFGDFTLTGDFGYAHEKENDAKTNKFYVSPGFAYQVTPASQVYGNYLYERVKGETTKDKTHGFLLGADYKLHKQVVVFLEGKYVTTKNYAENANGGYAYDGKTKDRAIGVGMRVYF